MNANRLSLLISHLENNVKEHDFNIAHWDTCAIGHACHIAEFKEAGLRLIVDSYPVEEGFQAFECKYPAFKGEVCFSACEKLFDISHEDVLKLFYDHTGRRSLPDEIDILRHYLNKAMMERKAEEYIVCLVDELTEV